MKSDFNKLDVVMRLNQMQNVLKQGKMSDPDKLYQKMGLDVRKSKKLYHEELFKNLQEKFSKKEKEFKEKQTMS